MTTHPVPAPGYLYLPFVPAWHDKGRLHLQFTPILPSTQFTSLESNKYVHRLRRISHYDTLSATTEQPQSRGRNHASRIHGCEVLDVSSRVGIVAGSYD